MSKPTVFELIRTFDPVVKRHVQSKAAGEYMVRRDRAILEAGGLPKEARPTVFVCKALTRSQRDRLDLYGADRTRWKLAFRMSLVEVRDIDEGGRLRSWTPSRADDELDDAALDALEDLGFGDDDIIDIGSAVEALSTVGKGVRPTCPLLGTSQRAWGAPSTSPRAESNEGESTGG